MFSWFVVRRRQIRAYVSGYYWYITTFSPVACSSLVLAVPIYWSLPLCATFRKMAGISAGLLWLLCLHPGFMFLFYGRYLPRVGALCSHIPSGTKNLAPLLQVCRKVIPGEEERILSHSIFAWYEILDIAFCKIAFYSCLSSKSIGQKRQRLGESVSKICQMSLIILNAHLPSLASYILDCHDLFFHIRSLEQKKPVSWASLRYLTINPN